MPDRKIDSSPRIPQNPISNCNPSPVGGGQPGDAVEQRRLPCPRCAKDNGDSWGCGEGDIEFKAGQSLADLDCKRSRRSSCCRFSIGLGFAYLRIYIGFGHHACCTVEAPAFQACDRVMVAGLVGPERSTPSRSSKDTTKRNVVSMFPS